MKRVLEGLQIRTGARNGNNGLELGTSDNCPLMSLTPSEKKLYQLYMSATSPMFLWNAKVRTCRVEREDIEVDKLAFMQDSSPWTNLFHCYTLY